jgi:uncharacterized protein YegP (UPF0339 family)
MTRSTSLKQAGAAAKKAPAVATAPPEPAAMVFLVDEDNGGGYYWTIVARGGETLVRSASFRSHEEAEQAAAIVHRGASRASFADRSDTERWLDEGSFSGEAVSR